MVIIGGLGNIIGSVISACVLTILPYVFGIDNSIKIIVHVAIMIVVIMFMKKDLILDYKKFLFGAWKDLKKQMVK